MLMVGEAFDQGEFFKDQDCFTLFKDLTFLDLGTTF